MRKNVNSFEEFDIVNEGKKGKEILLKFRQSKDEKEISVKDIIDDFIKKTGLTKKEAQKRLNKLAVEINKNKDSSNWKDEDSRVDKWEDENE